MKRLFILTALIVCLTVGIVYAANIVRVVDPQNQKEIWITEVYNDDDASATMTAGSVVVWDIHSSTGDNDNYVTETSTADTGLVAGVVYPTDIAFGATGTIAIYGIVDVDTNGAQTVDDVLCTSTGVGVADDCTTDAFGFCVVTEAADPGKCFINPRN
jgi:hypothetical protein